MTQEVLKLALDALALVQQHLEHPLGVQMTKQQIVVEVNKVSAAIKEALALQALHDENERLGLYKDAYAQPKQDLSALVTGMEVSIDVSTGDHDSGNRLFGVVDLVQQSQGSKHGLILLVQETKANFKEALAQPEQEPSGHFLDFAYSDSIAYVHVYDQFRKGQQFYKASPQRTWVDLTRTQMQNVYFEVLKEHRGGHQMEGQLAFGEALQAKIREKNT
jgi:hypothetical protein